MTLPSANRRWTLRATVIVLAVAGFSLLFAGNPPGTAASQAEVPSVPSNIQVQLGHSGELVASWSAPASDGGSAITGYKVQWKEAADSWDTPASVSETMVTGMSHTISGLTDGTEYMVRIIAVNGIGDGPPSSEETCPGGYDPDPTPVEVEAIPIVVDSTTEEYFVLYVKHDVDGAEVELPVSVTLGQDGTTTLAENVEALPAERYRVEKYLIADPADVDGDCVDDITELGNFGNMNPVNPAAAIIVSLGVVAVPDQETLDALSVAHNPRSFEGRLYVRFVLFDADTDRPGVYFLNTNTHWGHQYFLNTVGFERESDGMILGMIIYDPELLAPDGSPGVYLLHLTSQFSRDHYSFFSQLERPYALLAASVPLLDDNLAFYVPNSQLPYIQSELPLYKESRIGLFFEEDVFSETDFLALNPGEGYGRLRVMEPDERPNLKDIVVYEALPNELPRVAGIISTVPQTPLSHVNLRAVQDGVPNSFIRDALDNTDIDDLIDSYVHYTVTEDGWTLAAATPAEVDAHYASSRPATEQTPQRDLSVTEITPLGDIGFEDWTAFGVKAANVAVLGTLGFPEGTVPDGFAVPFYFYDEFMKHNELYDDIEEMLAAPDFQTDFDVQEDELKDLRKAVKKGETPEWIIEALTEMHATYSDGQSLRYRSSTNNEDLPGFNGAGLYDSKTQHPEETKEDGIAKSLKQVYASLWNFRAFTEREFHRIDHLAAAMGVLVHPNYSGELANGVAVSFDPFTSRECCYYVNTQIGEDLVTNPDAHSVPEEVLLRQNGHNVLATSNQLEPGQLLMSDDQMSQLRQHLEVIHEEFKELYSPAPGERFAMEIEFKITSDDILAIKQARPWVFSPNNNTRATGLPIISGTAQVGETLTASISGIDDADGLDNAIFSYQWLADEVDMAGATTSSYTLTDADTGKTFRVRVTFADDRGHQSTLTSVATAAVEPNRLMGTAIFVGGVDLEWTDVPGAESYEVQLFRNVQWIDLPGDGVEIAFYGAGAIISQLNHDGYTYWFQVRANNAKGSSEWSDPYLMQPTNHFEAGRKERPENVVATGAPAISGTAQVGKVLTADASAIEDGNGLNRVKFQYQWVSYDGTTDTDIVGATESAYRLQAAEEGKTLKVRVSFTDRHGYAESVTSAETATVLAAAPNVPPTGAPTISGPTHVSGTLTASLQGIDDQNGLRHAAFRYRWTATEGTTDTVVQDSENPIYVLEEADEGKTVQVDATFTDDDGYEETLPSVPTGAIGPRPNRPATGDPTVVGTVQVGETLTVDISDIEDADGLDNVSFSYQWLAGDADIAGATGDSYTLVADDKDKTISVRVSFTDRRDFEETLTSAATAPVEGVPDENSQRVDLHILNAPVGEHEAVLYRSTATLTPVNHIGNTHDSREDRNADFKLTGDPTVTLPALDRRQVGELAAAISATALTIPLTSIDGLRVGESIEIGAGGGELMRIASVDSDNKTIPVVERYKAKGGDSFVEPSAWPADTVVYHHRRARPERLPDYMVESGNKPSFTNFRMSWSGLDVPYLAINMSFADSDTELKDWRELLVYLRFRRADGEGRMVEGILPLGADGEMNLDDRQPGNPYTVREQHLRRYFGWPEDLDNDPDASVEVSVVDDAQRNSRFISGDERTFLQDVVDWIYADDGHDLGRIYPLDDRYAADEAEVLQGSPDTVSEELVRSYQVVVDVAFLDGTDPRIDTDQFSILTSGRADVIDLGDIGGAIASSTRSGSVNRSGDEYDHYRFTLSVPREVQLELTNLSGAAELVLESGSRTHLLRSDESGLQDELIITVLDAGVYQVRVQAQGGGTIDYQLRYRTALPAGNSPATGVPSISGTAQVGETLTASTSDIDDADGLDNVGYSYQWLADDTEITGATSSSYTLVDADAGLTIKVKVSFFDDKNNPETLTSVATTAVLANVPGAPEHINVSLRDTGALDVSWETPSTDGGSAITEYRVQWKETAGNWDTPADVSEETDTGTTHTITGLTDGVEYTVRIIAVNDIGDGPPSDEATGTPRETTPPELSTATVDGATLTLTYDEDLDENSEPSPDAFSVTVGGTGRAVDGVSVSGSSVTLTLASAVAPGATVTVSYAAPADTAAARIRDLAGNATASFSDQDVENNTPPPANTPAAGAPTISGTVRVGETLTADISGIGDDDGLPAESEFDYQWIRNDGSTDANIAGATDSTYVLLAADVGKFIKVQVTFTDKNDYPETLTSAATTAVTVPTRTTVTLSLHTTTLSEDASATTVTVTGTSGEVLTTDMDVTVSVTGGTADSGVDFTAVNDFTLTIPANSASRTATFELTPRNDSLVEGNETLTVSGTATYHDVEPASLTLTDGDSATISFGVDATTIAEADAGEATLMVSITNGVTFQRGGDVKVTLGGTAAAGWDYTFTDSVGRTFTKPYVVVMPAGASSVTATIAAVDDEGDDDAETVTVALTYDGVAVGSTQTITITDDDNAPALALSGLTIETTNTRAAYPAFDADTVHYAVGCEPADTLTVTPTATGSNVRISVSGTQTTSGASVTSTGLDGDSDITVVLANATGESRTYTIHCLPDDFPSVTVVKEAGAWNGLLVGSIGMGPLNRAPDRWSFLVIMDTNGVPRYHRKISGRIASHFRPQDGGAYPYGFFRNNPGELMLLDGNLDDAHLITRASWQSLTDHPGWEDAYPDIHDFVNKPDGTSVFVIDDPLTRDLSDIGFGSFGTEEMEDEIIIEVTPQGGFVKEVWNSWKNVELWDCTQSHFLGNAYSHFNSIELLTDGDYLISLRGCSKILKVDSETGDVLWRVGRSNLSDDEWTEKGRTPPYTIVDDPHDEFCGQHSAKIIGNGNLLLYDNGVYCVQHPETQETNRVNSVFSRVVEYALDHERGEARFLRHHSFESKFDAVTSATGLVAPMDNGNWWISWGRSTDADVTQSITEVDPSTNTELLHMLFEDDAGERRRTRSYPLRPDEFAPDLPPLTARIVEAPSSFDPGAAEGAKVVVAFNRPVVDFPANTPSVSVTGATATVAPLVEAGKPANAYVFTLTGEGGAIEFSLLADQTCASGGICAEDGTLLSVVPVTHTIPGPATQNTPATGAPSIGGTAQVGETLTVETSAIDDADGLDNVSYSYQWLANGADIAGATESTYTLVDDDAGLTIKVKVSFFDDENNPETLTSAATTAVAAAAPDPGPITGFTVVDTSDQSVEGTLADGGTLALDDPDGGSFGIRADLESGATIGSMRLELTGAETHDQTENIAPYSLYGDSGGNLSGESLSVGEYTLTATAYSEARLGGNVLGTLKVSFSVTGPATQQPNTPATGLPTISGTARVGETLRADISGIADVDGMSGAVFSYQWLANEVNIDTDIVGATDPTYTLVADDVGKAIRVRVSFMDGASNVETLTSEATATVVTPLTAGFQDAPDKHLGTGFFTFKIAFSEPISISYKTLRDDSLEVTNGSATKAKRVDGQSDRWEITVEPDSNAAVTVVLPITEGCGSDGAVCTRDGTKLSNRSELTVPGPAAANSPATGAPIISGTAEVGETLTVDTSGIDDADGMSGAVFSYQWLANDAEITGATGDTYTLVEADVGKAVKVRVIFNDDDNNEETLTSAATAAVAAETAVPDAPQSLNVSPDDTGTLDVSWEAPASDGGSPITGYKVQWKSGSEDYGGSAGSTRQAEITDPASRTHTITGLTDGVEYTVRVIAVNDVGDGPPSDEATRTPRETTPPELATATVDGTTLTLTYDEALDENSEPSSDAFSATVGGTGRAVDGVSVAGSSVILTLGSAVASGATVTVSYAAPTDAAAPRIQDEAGNPAASFSDQGVENNTPPPANTPATGAPTISGTAEVGKTLTASTSAIDDADGLDNVSYSYQWLANGADIAGATSSSYTLVDADKDKTIQVKVSFRDDKNNPETLTSAATATAAVEPRPNSPATGAPTISGTVRVGKTLTVETSAIDDADGMSKAVFTYQWLTGEVEIAGATDSNYTLVDDDAGKTTKVQVSFTDDEGNEETLTSEATAVVAAAAVESSIWASTLTVERWGASDLFGFDAVVERGELDPPGFSHDDVEYRVEYLILQKGGTNSQNARRLHFKTVTDLAAGSYILYLDGTPFPFEASGTEDTFIFSEPGLKWRNGDEVEVSLTLAD